MPKGGVPIRIAGDRQGWVYFDGRRVQTSFAESDVPAVRQQSAIYSKAIRDAIRTERISSKVLWSKPQGGEYSVTVAEIPRRMDPRTPPRIDALPRRQVSVLQARDFEVRTASIAAIAKDLGAKAPHLGERECRQLANVVFDQGKFFHESVEMSRAQQWMATSGMVALSSAIPVAVVVGQGLVGWALGDPPDWGEIALASAQGAIASGLGTGVGIVVTSLAVEQPQLGRAIAAVGRSVGLGSLAAYRVAGGFSGGAVASVALASILFANGSIDGEQWAVMSGVGIGATLVVAVAEVAVLSSVAALATASTGTAIGSLSGAAASSATLAWLGGGSIAAGGFGVTGGIVVLTAGGAVIVVVAGYGLVVAYETWEAGRTLDDLLRRLDLLDGRWADIVKSSPTLQYRLMPATSRF
jgi:hypothetical protein